MYTYIDTHTYMLENILCIFTINTMFVVLKKKTLKRLNKKESFIQDYCNRGEKMNTTLLEQKAGFSMAGVRKWGNTGGHFGEFYPCD